MSSVQSFCRFVGYFVINLSTLVTILSSSTAMGSILDTKFTDLAARVDMTPDATDIHKIVVDQASQASGLDYAKVAGKYYNALPARYFVTMAFTFRLKNTGLMTLVRPQLRGYFAGLGLPSDLNEYELDLFSRYPTHPLFKRIDQVKLPPRWKAGTLMRQNDIHYVIDAIHDLKSNKIPSNKAGFDEFKQAIEAHLGQPMSSMFYDQYKHVLQVREGIPPLGALALPDEAIHVLDRNFGHLVPPSRNSKPFADLLTRIKIQSVSAYGRAIDELPARFFVTEAFAKSLGLIPAESFVLKLLFNEMGLPARLSPSEFEIFEANPRDPLFDGFLKVDLPDRFLDGSLSPSGLVLVIDAIRAVKAGGAATSREHLGDLWQALEKHIGRNLDYFVSDKEGHLMVNAKIAALTDCQNSLGQLTTEELLNLQQGITTELLRRARAK